MSVRSVLITVVFCLLLLFTVSAGIATAQGINLEAGIDPDICSVGDRLSYTVTISGNVSLPDIIPPDFVGFQQLGAPSSSTQIQMINGKVSRSETLTFALRASKPGSLTIPSATAKHKRQIYKSNPVTVEITPAGRPPDVTNSKAVESKANSPKGTLPDVFLSARADKDTVYRNEMVTVNYDLYFKVNVSNYAFPRLPRMTGFWQEDFKTPDRPTIRDTKVRGIDYKVATIRKVGLFPTRTGTLSLEPLTAEVSVEVQRRRQRRSIWDDPFFSRNQSEVRSITTQPLEITVLDLPAEGKPPDFAGDVGQLNITVKYDNYEISQHDALNIEIAISGSGYLKSISAPRLNLPDGFEQFDPTVDERITTSGNQMRGRKVFKYLVIPRVSGTFQLRPIRFSYFDPETGKYQTRKSGGANIVVTPAESSEFSLGGFTPEEVAILGSDIRFIKQLDTPFEHVRHKVYHSVWFYLTLSIFPFLYIFGLGTETILHQRSSNPDAVRLRKAPDNMRKALKSAAKMLNQAQTQEALSTVASGLTEMVGALIHEPSAGLTGFILEKGLKEQNAPEELIEETKALLTETDHIRFSGANIDKDKASKLIERFRVAMISLEKLS